MVYKAITKLADLAHTQGAWKGAGWGMATMMLIDGVTYSIFGNAVAPGPSTALLRYTPFGGMHAIGMIMTVLAALMFGTVHRRNATTLRVLFAVFVFGSVIICYTVGGWWAAGQVGIGALSKWFLLTWLSLWLALTIWGKPQWRHR